MTEYSSLKFALYMLSEYINMVTVSAVATTLFLGGWRAPWPVTLWSGANSGWWPLLWFLIKVTLLIFVFVWLRGTLPRLRYDQFMRFGWKVLLPINLVWIMLVASIRTLNEQDWTQQQKFLVAGVPVAVLLLVFLLWPAKPAAGPPDLGGPPEGRVGGAEGYPIPPLDLEVPPSPRAKRMIADRQPVSTGAGADKEGSS
ncbi:hypothetical protein GCM10009682_58490 [Luedemannella flava]|uniref:NADH-ubiquinone oxidoreductase chain 1 n=1 Tax=Luedemannella flava TaxID=349316 RepID=A0ABN2MQL2_9ACTN